MTFWWPFGGLLVTVDDLLVTFQCPFSDALVIFWWPFGDHLVLFGWPFIYLSGIFPEPFGGLLVAFWWPFGGFLVYFWWPFNIFLVTFSDFDELLMTFQWSFSNLSMAFNVLLLTFEWPFGDLSVTRITKRCLDNISAVAKVSKCSYKRTLLKNMSHKLRFVITQFLS